MSIKTKRRAKGRAKAKANREAAALQAVAHRDGEALRAKDAEIAALRAEVERYVAGYDTCAKERDEARASLARVEAERDGMLHCGHPGIVTGCQCRRCMSYALTATREILAGTAAEGARLRAELVRAQDAARFVANDTINAPAPAATGRCPECGGDGGCDQDQFCGGTGRSPSTPNQGEVT